jgi:hypothetical protein
MLGSLNKIGVPLGACVLMMPGVALAGFDCPGRMEFEYFADEETKYYSLDQLPLEAEFSQGFAPAYFSSDASEFEEEGVLIWSGIDLQTPEGPATGMLKLDLRLTGAQLAGPDHVPIHNGWARASYIEKSGDQLRFEGQAVFGNIWLLDALLLDEEDSALEAEFVLIFADASGVYPGSRVLIGHVRTEVSPQDRRRQYQQYPTDSYVREVETGCDGEVVVESHHDTSGCDGDTYEEPYESDSGCEGDTYDGNEAGCGGDDYYDDSDSCEGDTGGYDDSSCEGDSGGFDDSSCEGDTSDSSCESTSSGSDYDGCETDDSSSGACDDAYAATIRPRPRRRGGPLRALMRFFPEIAGISFIVFLKRRSRRSAGSR